MALLRVKTQDTKHLPLFILVDKQTDTKPETGSKRLKGVMHVTTAERIYLMN